jgi:AcrR family transcriptional regulator
MSANVASDGRELRGAPDGETVDRRVPTVERRILEATLSCIADGGLARLTVDDVARAAGCGRATVYRVFPGGKEQVVLAAANVEVERFFRQVGADLDAADDLTEVLVVALTGTARFVQSSAPLRHLLETEPAVILAHVAFDKNPVVFGAAQLLLGTRLQRFLPPEQVGPASEWMARLALSHLALPNPSVDLTDADAARRLVATFVVPGLVPTATSSPPNPVTTRS